MTCRLEVKDPILKSFLKETTFDSYTDFRKTFEKRVLEGFVPIGTELKPVSYTVDGFNVGDVNYSDIDSIVEMFLSGLLDGSPEQQFKRFVDLSNIYNVKYNTEPVISNIVKDKDLDFLKSTLSFIDSIPLDQDFMSSEFYQEFLTKKDLLVKIINDLDNRDVEPEFQTNESELIDKPHSVNYIYSLPAYYQPSSKETLKNTDSLSVVKHQVSLSVEQELKNGKKFFVRLEPDNETNIQSIPIKDIEYFGVVGVLYEEVAGELKRVYVKSAPNNPEQAAVLTTQESEAIVLDKNGSKNFTFTVPDFTNPNYIIRDNPVNAEVIEDFIVIREQARTSPSRFYPVTETIKQFPKSPAALGKRKSITAKEFIQGSKAKLELATEKDRIFHAGNLFVRFANLEKAPLDRTPLSAEFKQLVLDLLNYTYQPGEVDGVVENLNNLMEFKGGDVQFFARGNRIVTYRKSEKVKYKGKIFIRRLDKMEEVPFDQVSELLDYARISVHKDWLGQVVPFPIIDETLKFVNIDFNEFYLEHHVTSARQVEVNGQLHFHPIYSVLFDLQTEAQVKLAEVAKKLEDPKVGTVPIVADEEIDLLTLVEDFPNLANETTGETRDALILIHALSDNEEVRGKLSKIKITFDTKTSVTGISDNDKIIISHSLIGNSNYLGDVLAHEIIHSLTTDWIVFNSDSQTVKELNELLELVPKEVFKDERINVFELLASLSNPEIAQKLKSIKVENKSLLEKITDLFKEILNQVFGLDYLKQEPTVYTELVNKLIKIASTPLTIPVKPKSKLGLSEFDDVEPLPMGYSEKDVTNYLQSIGKEQSKTFLNNIVKSIDADLAHWIHTNNLLQDFIAGRLDFTTVFRNFFKVYVKESNKDNLTKGELEFLTALTDKEFIEEYWLENTNFAKVRKTRPGEKDGGTKIVPLEQEEVLPDEDTKEPTEYQSEVTDMIDQGGNEEKLGIERGTDKSSLEAADPLSRAFVKMLPKVELENGTAKIYTEEEYENSDQKDHFVKVPTGYIKFAKNSLGRLELCDYTKTWNLIALNLANTLSLEEMFEHIDNHPELLDIVPEIYVFKARLDVPITNEFKAILRGNVETAFKKASVGVNVIIKDKNGNFLLIDEGADFTQTAKHKVNSEFIISVRESLSNYYDVDSNEFKIKKFLIDQKLIDSQGIVVHKVEREDKWLEQLGFVFNEKTKQVGGFPRPEFLTFKKLLVGFLSNFDTIPITISDFVTSDQQQGKIQGLSKIFKQVYGIENQINPLITTTMVKNAEGENQATLSVFNTILQSREHYNKAQTLEGLNELIPRTKNDIFEYSLSKRILFNDQGRTKNKVHLDILSGLKVVEEGRATKGNLTINLTDADWMRLNFIGMLKAGMIENTRAETASTSYTFRMSNWNAITQTNQQTPFTLADILKVWNSQTNEFEINDSSLIYRVWSDYLKGELSRINKQGVKEGENFGLFADILNEEDKDILLRELLENSDVDALVTNSQGLILNAINRFFNDQFKDYSDDFENKMGGYASIISPIRTEENKGDTEIYNLIYKVADSASGRDNKEEYKAFYVANMLTIHTEETILFQGDLTTAPKYFKRAKGVQSTGTPQSKSQALQGWVNEQLKKFSFGSLLGKVPEVGRTFNSATIADDVKKSAYYDRLLEGFKKSRDLFKSQTGVELSSKDEELIDDYLKTNIGDGDAVMHPDYAFALLSLVGNINSDQIKVFQALALDAKKNAKKYGLGEGRLLTDDEELILQEGMALIKKEKGIITKFKVTYRGNAVTNDPVAKEIMDKFAIIPLFPQFTYNKPVAHALLKRMITENKAYVKFESGTKIQNTGVTDFINEIEKGNLEITLENSTHTLLSENLREQIKTPIKVKSKNTFGSQFRKLIISGLTILGKPVKLQNEENAGETVKKWKRLNQELSSVVKEQILNEFGITKTEQGLDYSQVNLEKVAKLLLKEAKRRDVPSNIQIYFDKYRENKLTNKDKQEFYNYLEASFGNQQIQSLLASIVEKISIQKLEGAQLIQVSESFFDRYQPEGKTRELGFYEFKDDKVTAAECKVSLIGDFKHLLNLPEVREKTTKESTVLERLEVLNDLLKEDSFVEKYRDQLTTVGYRIPTQGFNSMDVMVIREFLPPFYGPIIVCPPEIVAKSGTDYDYDKMSMLFPGLDKNGNLSDQRVKSIQNEMIKTSADILLDPVNYHRLILPNTNKLIFDFVKGTEEQKGLLSRLGISTKEPKNTQIITHKANLAKFSAVKRKDLLGIAAVWNTFTTLIQNHQWVVNPQYNKTIGFGTKQTDITVKVNPILGNRDSYLSNTQNGTPKLEAISQLINVTVDMPSDDAFGLTNLDMTDFGAFIYSLSMLGYDFETTMLLFHQPVIYKFKQKFQEYTQKGGSVTISKFMAISDIMGIEIPTNFFGNPDFNKFEIQLFEELEKRESGLDIFKLDKGITDLAELKDKKITDHQLSVFSHYLKLIDQADQIRTVQSALNFDSSPDSSLYKAEKRDKNYREAISANLINKDKIDEIMTDSVISGLYVSPVLKNLAEKIFPILYQRENSEMFSSISDQFIGKEERAYIKAMNGFLLSILQNFGTYNDKNITDFALDYLKRKERFSLINQADSVKKQLRKEGIDLRLLDILLQNNSTKRPDPVYNLQVFLGFENSPEDKNQITEEWRLLLNHKDFKVREFAKTLAVVGTIQSGWSKSPLYFSDLIPEEFITPIIDEALSKYQELSPEQKFAYRENFNANFYRLEGGTLGKKDSRRPDGIRFQKDPHRFMDYTVGVQKALNTIKQSSDDFLDFVESVQNKVQASTDTYQYYGATYTINLNSEGKGISVQDYQGKKSKQNKLLEAYNTNPNVDPQTGQPFRVATQQQSSGQITDKFFEFKDGFKLPTKFALNQEQQESLLELESFINSKEKTITLSGAAGTGKSTLISIFNEWLERKKYIYPKYSAPTHRANAVTKLMNPDVSVYTLHQLFGLSPDLDLVEGNYDVKKLEFSQNNNTKIEWGDVLIIDESSMINDTLFDFIQSQQEKLNLRVIYVGDVAQLKPVKQDAKSKVFTAASHKTLTLTKVERTGDNAILEESVNIREGKDWSYQTKLNQQNEGVVYINSREELLDIAKENFKTQINLDNKLYFRILSATNKAVEEINNLVRKVLYNENSKQQLVVGDIIMGYDNFDYNYQSGQYRLYNGGDYEITEVRSSTKKIELAGAEEIFSGYQVVVKNLLDSGEKPYSLFVVDKNESDEKAIKFANRVQELQKEGAKLMRVGQTREAAQLFSSATALKNQLAFMKDIDKFDPVTKTVKTVLRKTFDYGYAHTIHKSQGGTYNKVMILADTIKEPFDKTTQQELKYVAVSRARQVAYIRTSHKLKQPVQIQKSVEQSDLSKINFIEDKSTGYAERTKKNASADATIAFAVDFNSAGEKLTKKSVLAHNKLYIPIDANNLEITPERVNKIANALKEKNIKSLNIAGNGIYTMKGKYTQQQVDEFTLNLLSEVHKIYPFESIRSGGQTGFDEAGAKAGIRLGLPTTILAPKGWKFRNSQGQDISDEQQFKARFETQENNDQPDTKCSLI